MRTKAASFAALAFFFVAFGIVGRMDKADAEKGWNTCKAPCVVTFGDDMAEDMFDFNYNGNGTVEVWEVKP